MSTQVGTIYLDAIWTSTYLTINSFPDRKYRTPDLETLRQFVTRMGGLFACPKSYGKGNTQQIFQFNENKSLTLVEESEEIVGLESLKLNHQALVRMQSI